MTENNHPPSIPEDPQSSDPLSNTQPGRRMRRMLDGSRENEAAMNSADLPTMINPPGPDGDATQSLPPAADGNTAPGGTTAAGSSPAAGPTPDETQVTRPGTRGRPGRPVDSGQTLPISDTQGQPPARPSDPTQTRPISPESTRAGRAQGRRSLPQEPAPPPGSSPPPPFGGDTAQLPRRVEEVDPSATRVTPAAYQSNRPVPSRRGQQANYPPGGNYPPGSYPPAGGGYPPSPPTYTRSVGVPPRGYPAAGMPVQTGRRKAGWRRSLGCMLRALVGLLFLVVFVTVAAGSWLVFQYFAIARGLPPVAQLRERASQFETTRIFDRNGGILYEIIDPNAGRRTFVPLEKISPNLIAATLATEDREYWDHPGFDPFAIARAFYQNYTSGEVVSGASTITQQLARMLLLPDERFEQSYERKAREIVLAAEITRNYSKQEILELYLNESNYGNLAYGIEAAAETYFNTTAENLTLGQASFLAGLPQSPAIHDIYANREDTLRRHKQVVLLMLEVSQQKGCIEVANEERVCFNEPEAIQAVQEIEAYNFQIRQSDMRYPHWVNYVRSLLEAQYDPQTIYRSGFSVYTTIDPALQDQAQAMVTQQVEALADRNAHNGALVAVRPATGEILAMVGSPNFRDEDHAGQVNMAVSPRQPGSSIKPLTYAAAFEKGWTPSTLIWDVPSDFPPSGDPNDTRPPYQPVNYDGRFHGPATVRSALANSYNIPAVKALQFTGIYGDGGLVNFARRLGIETLTRDDYGLSLTLGGGEVTLLDMTSAFGTFGNNGVRLPPVAITRITDFQGNLIYEYQPPAGQPVVRPEHAFLISSILSDNEARTPMFGANSVLNLPFQVAAKTGTTNDFRDNWTIGYTPDLAVGVWIGNADYTPMQNVTGLTGAAPAWSSFMQFAVPHVTGGSPSLFPRPAGITEKVICAISGTEPSEFCPQQRSELFAVDQNPLPKEEDLWKKTQVDTWTNLRASAECPDFSEERFTLNVEDPWALRWIRDTEEGRAWAASVGFQWPITFVPQRECTAGDPRPQIIFAGITDRQTITANPLDIYAVIHATANFRSWRLEWGPGEDPAEWRVLVENNGNQYQNAERIHTWDLTEVPAGMVTLRIWMDSIDQDAHAEKRIVLNLNVPTPTPTATPTVTLTPTPTNTLPPTQTFTPQPTSTNTPVPPTAAPTETPTSPPAFIIPFP